MTFVLMIESISGEWSEEIIGQRVGDLCRYTLLKKDKKYESRHTNSIHTMIKFRNKFLQPGKLLTIVLFSEGFYIYLSSNDNNLTMKLEEIIASKYKGYFYERGWVIPPIDLNSLLTTNRHYEFKENPFNTFDELSNDVRALIQDFLNDKN